MHKNLEVIGQILEFIRHRRYEQGDRLLSERDFSAKFGVTRQYIREAIATLEAVRVVERRSNSGIYLRDVDAEGSIDAMVLQVETGGVLKRSEVADSMELRRILEVQAVRLACERCDNDDLEFLANNLEETKKKIDAGESIAVEDRQFHQRIIASTRNKALVRVVNSFYELSRQRRDIYFSDLERCQASYEQHIEIFEAIKRRRVGQASKCMENNLTRTVAAWEILLSTQRSDQIEDDSE